MQAFSRTHNKRITACLAIEEQDAKEAGTIAYMARGMIMATMPHSKPDGDVYYRKCGNWSLTMIANPQFGLPYGSLPRLLIAWLARQVKLTGSPEIYLGKSFAEFLAEFNLSSSGGKRGDATYLQDQMRRLFTTTISCVYQDKKEGVCKGKNFSVAQSFHLWWDPVAANDKNFLQHSTITLSEPFFRELLEGSVPVDFRVLLACRRSSLQIDIYNWLTYRLSNLKNVIHISWGTVQSQFGSNYANNAQGLRDFKKHFLKALRIVRVFYHEAQLEIDNGLVLYPSPPHVKSKPRVRRIRSA
jgi:hypothetical protein